MASRIRYYLSSKNLGKFDGFIMICICLNILTMAMDYDGSTIAYVAILDDLNLAFTSVFISEATSKLIAFGLNGT